MKALYLQGQQWFKALPQRQQRLLLAMAVIMALAFCQFAVWKPLSTGVQQARTQLDASQQTLLWAENALNNLASSATTNNKAGGSLVQLVNQSRSRFGLTFSQMQPKDNSITLRIDEAPFNQLLAWLAELERSGVHANTLELQAADTAGTVKVSRLILEN